MTDIRGIHYEISEPKLNETDGHYYQRVRQVDGQGNLVGIGEQRVKLPNLNSTDGQYQRDLDWLKLGKLGGDVGQIGIGALKRDPRMITNGAISFGKDVQNGVFRDYDSWPGTDRPWERGDIPAPSFDGGAPNSPPNIGTPGPRSDDTSKANQKPLAATAWTNQAAPAPSGSDAALGIVSGKPMRFFGAPIFDTRTPSAPSGQDAFDGSASQDAQGPLSLNDAYLEYLKRLNVPQAQ
jgi:hypothetical protein